jgi:hypothetical protein
VYVIFSIDYSITSTFAGKNNELLCPIVIHPVRVRDRARDRERQRESLDRALRETCYTHTHTYTHTYTHTHTHTHTSGPLLGETASFQTERLDDGLSGLFFSQKRIDKAEHVTRQLNLTKINAPLRLATKYILISFS